MFVLYILTGILAGVLGGMGMGGGTVLIPMLTIFFGVKQHVAQAINLISFIPMAIIAIILHAKNHLIDFKCAALIIFAGLITSLGGSFLAKSVDSNVLSRIFGGFLIVLAIIQLISTLKNPKTKK